jgi:hypothetical protein
MDVGLTESFGGVAAFDRKGNKIIDKLMAQIKINSLPSAFL